MTPITTKKTVGIYGAPKGREQEIGGLPFYREDDAVCSIWELEDEERKAIASGANVRLRQLGEPIQPVALEVIWEEYYDSDGS
jgi:hypothetical protein